MARVPLWRAQRNQIDLAVTTDVAATSFNTNGEGGGRQAKACTPNSLCLTSFDARRFHTVSCFIAACDAFLGIERRLSMIKIRRFAWLVGFSFLATQALAQDKPTQSKPAYEERNQPVSKDDLQILKRADEILSDETKWNRKDDRTCKPEDKAWSLFCALQKASLEVLGKYDHRRVALQEVRFAVEDATRGREFEHRLMDYNNLTTTQFKDIKQVLKVATEKVAGKLRETR